MNSGFLVSALAIIAGLTSLTVEAIKKLLGDRKYSAKIIIALTFLSFLASTVGFDKVKQLFDQIGR